MLPNLPDYQSTQHNTQKIHPPYMKEIIRVESVKFAPKVHACTRIQSRPEVYMSVFQGQ